MIIVRIFYILCLSVFIGILRGIFGGR